MIRVGGDGQIFPPESVTLFRIRVQWCLDGVFQILSRDLGFLGLLRIIALQKVYIRDDDKVIFLKIGPRYWLST